MGMLLIRKRRNNKTVVDAPETDFNNKTVVDAPETDFNNMAVVDAPETDFDNMTVADLKNHAEENSIDLNGATKKADIINAIIGDTNG